MSEKRIERVLLPLAGAGLVLLSWQLAVVMTKTTIFPSPAAVARALVELWRRGVLGPYVRDSLVRVGAGYGLAALVGVPLGTLMGRYRSVAVAVNPQVQFFRPISPLAWIPVAILLFGISNFAAIFLVFLGSLFPIVLATMNGVSAVAPMYLQAGTNFGLSPAALMFRVMLPAAMPEILGGLRVALGVAWIVVVAAEMIAVDSGLGYLIIDARNAGKRYDLVVAGMLLIGVIGLALDVLMRRLERMDALRWGFHRE